MTNPDRISANDLREIELAFRDGRPCLLGMGGVVARARISRLSIGNWSDDPTTIGVELTIQFTAESR